MTSGSRGDGAKPSSPKAPPSSSPSLAPPSRAPSSSPSLAPGAIAGGFHDAEAARRAAEHHRHVSAAPRSIPPNPVLLALEAQRRTSHAPSRSGSSLAPRVFERPPPGLNTKVIKVSSGVSWQAVAITAGAIVVVCAIAAYLIFR
jgi:hypothetical protein